MAAMSAYSGYDEWLQFPLCVPNQLAPQLPSPPLSYDDSGMRSNPGSFGSGTDMPWMSNGGLQQQQSFNATWNKPADSARIGDSVGNHSLPINPLPQKLDLFQNPRAAYLNPSVSILNEIAVMAAATLPPWQQTYIPPSTTTSSRSASPGIPGTPNTPGTAPDTPQDLMLHANANSVAQSPQNNVDHMMQYVQAIQKTQPASGPSAPSTTNSSPANPSLSGLGPGASGATRSGRVNKPLPKYKCGFGNCEKRFRQRAHLETHIRSHTGERPFKCPCDGCPKRFSQLCNLRTHMRSHTGEKPYGCDVCGKAFSQRGNLRNHMAMHNSERQLSCQLDGCTKMFTQLGNLKAHHNTAHAATLASFTQRLQCQSSGEQVPGDALTPEENRIFTYFCSLYKNSNRGNRGRGQPTPSI